jgi:hypothetical protein
MYPLSHPEKSSALVKSKSPGKWTAFHLHIFSPLQMFAFARSDTFIYTEARPLKSKTLFYHKD